jgi:CRISPR-associated endonuclease/helicase Cas3
MTATLPEARRKRLQSTGLTIYPAEDDRAALAELSRLEAHPRYVLRQVDDANAALQIAIAAIEDGNRVLWVVNTVARCQALAQELEATTGQTVLSYHSRFRLCDRQRVHRQTVSAFQSRSETSVALTTQVCEMSLDLDADVLITETAPISAMIQRFGRANRHLARGSDFRAKLVVYSPPRPAPYLLQRYRELTHLCL